MYYAYAAATDGICYIDKKSKIGGFNGIINSIQGNRISILLLT